MSTSRRRASLFYAPESPYYLLERQRNPSGCNTGRKAIDFSENKCWIPPGFRGRSIPFKILSALLYSMLFYGTLFMELEGTGGKTETMLNRVLSFIFSSPLYCSLETEEDSGDIYLYLIAGIEQKRLWALSSIYLFLW